MTQYVQHGGVWKPVAKIVVRDGGLWKEAQSGHVRDGGVWKEFHGVRLEHVTSATSAVASINLPAGVQAGDLIVIAATRLAADMTYPAAPAGYSSYVTAFPSGGTLKTRIVGKRASGAEGGSAVNFAAGGGATYNNNAHVFRPSANWVEDARVTMNVSSANAPSGTVDNDNATPFATPALTVVAYASNTGIVPPGRSSGVPLTELVNTANLATGYVIFEPGAMLTDFGVSMGDGGLNWIGAVTFGTAD